MDGIIGGLLGYLQDPRRTQQVQGIGNAIEKGLLRLQESDRQFKELADRAFDPKNPGRIKDKEALKELTDMTMTGLLGFAPAGLTVFHGSPAKFKQFDPTKIGSGEGSQAYGYGHYVAESPTVAKEYRTALSEPELFIKGRQIKTSAGSNLDTAKAWLQDSFEMGVKNPYADAIEKVSNSPIKDKQGVIDALKKLETRGVEMQKGGFEYKIDLPDEQIAKMLDWDKPLSKQPKEAQNFLSKISFNPPREDQTIGEWLKPRLSEGMSPYWSEDLRKAGIPGIRYLDQGSRGTGQGTSNFVVFPGNEELLRILERNNVPLGLLD